MANILKQSTAIKVRVGPFMDAGDAVTPETGVSLSTADQAELLKANGAATVDISGATWAAVTGADGWYDLSLTASHTDTIGELVVVVQDASVCLPVFARFQVVEESIYDALMGASAAGFDANGRVDVGNWLGTAVTLSATTAKPQVDVDSIDDDATAADNLELDYDGTGYNKSNSTIGTCTTNTDMRGTDSALLASSAPTNFSSMGIEADGHVHADLKEWKGSAPAALADTDKVPSSVQHDALGLALAAKLTAYVQLLARSDAAIETDNATELGEINANGGSGAGDYSAQTDSLEASQAEHDATQSALVTIDDFIDTEVAAILEDTGTTLPDLINALNDLSAAEVNAEVLDVLNVDTFAQPGQGTPAATTTIRLMIAYLYKWARNKRDNDGSTTQFYNDDTTTVDHKQSTSESGGTVTVGEMATGP